MGIATSTIQNWTSAKEPIAKKAFVLALGREVKGQRDMFFRVEKSDKLQETYFDYGDIGNMGEFTGVTSYESWDQNYQMQIAAKLYRKGMAIDYQFIRTDQQNVVKDGARMLGLAARRRLSGDAMSPFNNPFDGSYVTRDGLALCSTAHTSNVGGSTQSNSGTLAFSPAAVEATRIAMQKFRSNRDNVLEIDPDMLVGPVDLDGPFKEVTGSDKAVNTNINNLNIHKGVYTTVTSTYVVDSNNWFMVDTMLMKENLVWNVLDEVSFGKDTDFDSRRSKWVVDAYYGQGPLGWEWIYGHNVA